MSDTAVVEPPTAELELDATSVSGKAYKISEHRYGRAVVTLLAKDIEGKDGKKFARKFFSVEKIYKDANDKWQSTSYFEPSELADLQLATDHARRAVHLK